MIDEATLLERRNTILGWVSRELRSTPFIASHIAVDDGRFPLTRLYIEMVGRQAIANDYASLRDGRQYALLRRATSMPIGVWIGSTSGGITWRLALRENVNRFHESVVEGGLVRPRIVPTPDSLEEGSNAVTMLSHNDVNRTELCEALGFNWRDTSFVGTAEALYPIPSNGALIRSLTLIYDGFENPADIGFAPQTLLYRFTTPRGATAFTISVQAHDEGAQVRMRVNELPWAAMTEALRVILPDGNIQLSVIIEVTAEDQFTQSEYNLQIARVAV